MRLFVAKWGEVGQSGADFSVVTVWIYTVTRHMISSY
jgi:hypothetical protein